MEELEIYELPDLEVLATLGDSSTGTNSSSSKEQGGGTGGSIPRP